MIKDNLVKAIEEAIKKAGYQLPEGFVIEEPPDAKLGDLATNAAFLIAHQLGVSPKEVATKIVDKFTFSGLEKAEISPTGFINLRFTKKYYQQVLSEILLAGDRYAQSEIGKGQKALIEFVSANPTGPLHIGNARGGPIGEVIANVLSWLGYRVFREFYINDLGSQIRKFGETLAYYYIAKKDPDYHFPEGGYPGEFLKSVSEEIQRENPQELAGLRDDKLIDFFIYHGLKIAIRRIKDDLKTLGITFDRFQYESDLVNSGKSHQIIEELREKKAVVEREGAVWFSSDEYSNFNDRDSVLVRSDSQKSLTYFANDIAYHKMKFDRGFDRVIDIWGANHHGHIPRLKASLKVLGYDPAKLEIILYQNVRLKQGDKIKQMSKRLGNFINVSDLITKLKVPADVFKYMIVAQSSQNIIDFDLDLALERSEKNPVFYLQYAYARICSVIRNSDQALIKKIRQIIASRGEEVEEIISRLENDKEIKLIKVMQKLPEILIKIERNFQVQALPSFATELARAYHDFYATCRILSKNKKITEARLVLIFAVRDVLKISLSLMSISAPERM